MSVREVHYPCAIDSAATGVLDSDGADPAASRMPISVADASSDSAASSGTATSVICDPTCETVAHSTDIHDPPKPRFGRYFTVRMDRVYDALIANGCILCSNTLEPRQGEGGTG